MSISKKIETLRADLAGESKSRKLSSSFQTEARVTPGFSLGERIVGDATYS
jgi:hypothetical protein